MQKRPGETSGSLARYLDAWAQPESFGIGYRAGMREFYEVFYREEERRIALDVERGLARAKELAARLQGARGITHPGGLGPRAPAPGAGGAFRSHPAVHPSNDDCGASPAGRHRARVHQIEETCRALKAFLEY